MFHGIWQLTKLSLTTDARRIGLHAVRFGLIAVLYLAVCYASWNPWAAAPGQSLFRAQILISTLYISMASIFEFSQALTEEKEEESLGLIRLAEISPLAILLAKLSAMLIDAGLLIVVQFPFTVVAITLGGVSWPQVYAAYIALTVYLWMLVAVGLVVSVIQPTGPTAARMTAIVVAGYLLPLMFVSVFPFRLPLIQQCFEPFSLPLRLLAVSESAFQAAIVNESVLFGLITGTLCVLFAWFRFDRYALARQESPQKACNVLTSKSGVSQRSWDRPLIWREYLFVNGGRRGFCLRVLIQFAILTINIFYYWPVTESIGFILAWSSIFSGLFVVLDGTWTISRLFRDEVRHQTWSALVQTPHSIFELAREKAYGWAMALAPTILSPYLFLTAMFFLHEHIPRDFFIRAELVVGSATIGVAVLGYLHLLALLSLYLGTTAIPMTVTTCFAAGWLYVNSVFSSNISIGGRCVVFLLTSIILGGVIWSLQRVIQRRLGHLAATA